ncbi:TPA: hypothetical protein ACH3X3_000884 [Trebouxia sp. C0006]
MAQVCTCSNAFFSRNSLPRPAVSRSAAHRNRISLVRASGQSGDLFFVTNNVFKVKQEGCQQFEETWKNRESRLKETPGFLRFALLRGDEEGEYISQTTWASRQAFKDWTQSQNFAKAHGTGQGEQDKKPEHGSKRAGMAELLDGPPKPRFYEAVTVTEQYFFWQCQP